MSNGENSPPSSLSPSITPNGSLVNQVPKNGTVIPNRVFVGGIAPNTTEQDLKNFFSTYGAVKDTKIICDRAAVSKGYGFVTFETQEDAEKIIKKEFDNLVFKDRKLNIGPAVRKQQTFPRNMDGIPVANAGMFISSNPYAYASTAGLAMLQGPTECQTLQALQQQVQPPVTQYSNMMIPPQLYMQQPPYQYAATPLPVTSQAQVLQYANQQWAATAARCYQPSATTVTNPAAGYMYSMPPEFMYPSGVQPQFLDMTDPTQQLLEQANSQAEAQRSTGTVAPSSKSETTSSQYEGSKSTPSIISMQNTRSGGPQASPQPSYLSNQVQAPQPPPMKKMTPMPSQMSASQTAIPISQQINQMNQLAQRCYGTPMTIFKQSPGATPYPQAGGQPAGSARIYAAPALTYHLPPAAPKVDEMRAQFEHDNQLAASIAPPTPPATPASALGH